MNSAESSAEPASWKNLLKIFPVALVVGNVLGVLEILYIYFRLRTLAVSSPLELVSYAAGGGVVYGALFGLFVGAPIALAGVLAWREVRRDPEVRFTALVLVLLAAGFLFPVITQRYFLDVPGLFELDRFADVILGLSFFAGLMYVALRYVTVLHPLLRSLSRGLDRPRVLRGILIVNLLGLGAAWPVFWPERPTLPERSAAGAPPVILIGVDTLRADHLGPYESDLGFGTPAARMLAEDGVTYLNHSAQWPRTTPSFASAFTSLYPAEIPVHGNSEPIPRHRRTLAERLKDRGYVTLGIVSSYAVHRRFLGQGFDVYVNREDWGLKNLKLVRYGLNLLGGSMPTSLTARWLRSDPPRPFFLFVHYIVPHAPYHPPYPFSRGDTADYGGRASGSQEALDAIREGTAYDRPADRRHVRSLYDGEVAFTDRRIRTLLQVLRETGLYQRSLIVYMSDHGENMDQHDRETWFKHSTLYQSDLDVPLIIKYPGNRNAGRQVRTLTSNLDLVPTILAELDVPVRKEKPLRGKSLRPGDLSERDRVFSQRRDAAALRTTRWKYILRFESGREELYDLSRDPREQQNRAEDYPERVRRWRSLLEAFRERHYRPPSDHQPTEKDRTRLEGLGYM